MFKPLHWLVLLSTCIMVPLICIWLTRKSKKTIENFIRCCAIVALLFDPVCWLWEIKKFGFLDLATALPLYICSLFWMLLPIAAFVKESIVRQTAKTCLCTVCMVGGILGLVFNIHLNQYPFFSFIPIQSLLYHFLMILVATVMWCLW